MTPEDRRTDPPLVADGTATVLGSLDRHRHRQTLAWTCADLTPQQLATRAVPTSELTPLELVRHLAADVSAAWAISREVARAVRSVGQLPLDTVDRPHGHDEDLSLRWILVHLVEEYARHDGHADLLREAPDGVTGE